MDNNTFLLHETEAFMRGDLDNVTVAGGQILLDMVQGTYVPYGCYTTPTLPFPLFDALRASWNVDTPIGTAVEVQVRALVDGSWTSWCSFGRWSPYLPREGAVTASRGPLRITADQLTLQGKAANQAQLRIYLYTREEKASPSVRLLALSCRPLDVTPEEERPLSTRLRLIPYVVARRAPALREQMDLAICLTSLTNRWGADLLPEELALAMRDHRGGSNLSFAAAAAACWGFPAWVGWADLGDLRSEARAGYGTIVMLESTPAQVEQGLPAVRYAALRGFTANEVLLMDPWAGETDFDAETTMPLEDFLTAWNHLALFMRPRVAFGHSRPMRYSVSLRPMPDAAAGEGPRLYGLYLNGSLQTLPDNLIAHEEMGPGVLAWSVPDPQPHATTAHRHFHYVLPEAGGIRLPAEAEHPKRFTVYAIAPNGSMMVGDVTI